MSSTTSFVTEMEVVMQARQNTHQFFLTHTVQASLLNKDADQVSPTNIV